MGRTNFFFSTAERALKHGRSSGSMATELRECKKSQHNHNRSYSDAFKATSSSSASCFSFSCSKNRLASKHATQQKVKPKSKKAKFAPHFHKDLHVQLEQVWCFRCISVWELMGRKNIKASGAALCKYRLLAESFYLSLLSKTWVDRI